MRTVLIDVPQGPPRARYLALFELADDSPTEIARYCQQGELIGLLDADLGVPIGQALVLPVSDGVQELKSLAIDDRFQGRGLGRKLVAEVVARAQAQRLARLVVGTSSTSVGTLLFYQKVGFRPLRVERDYFTQAKGYGPECIEDGIPVRDMIWLDREFLRSHMRHNHNTPLAPSSPLSDPPRR